MMKKKYFLGAMAAFGLLAFSSCSSDDDPITGGEQELTGEQVIVLDMQDTDVLSTKSRPLYSTASKGAEEVTHVKLFVFKVLDNNTQKLLKTIDIPNWDQIATEYDYGRKYSIRLTNETGKIEYGEGDNQVNKDGGKITIVAVGQNEKTTTPAPFTWSTDLSLSGDWSTALAQVQPWSTNEVPGKGFSPLFTEAVGSDAWASVSEIFSGTSEETPIRLDGGFEAKVLLKRQVAGVLGYFKDIPALVNNKSVKTVRLVASQRNTQLDLTVNLGTQEDNATGTNGALTDNVVNGFTAATIKDAKYQGDKEAYTVYTIDLTKWFTGWTEGAEVGKEWGDNVTAETLLNEDNWVNAFDAADKHPVVARGAVLAGEFVIPFSKLSAQNTFELQLLDKDNNVLKAWNVKLDKASQAQGDAELVYGVYRNHLYQIGERGAGDDPNLPDKDDKPQSLNKDQDLIIKINDQWEFIHNMEIE